MIGKFIVYESHFYDRLFVRKITGETNAFWIVERCSGFDTHKVKKASVGPYALFDDEKAAVRVKNQFSDKLLKARKHFTERRGEIMQKMTEQGLKE